jgi:hypothetical protein
MLSNQDTSTLPDDDDPRCPLAGRDDLISRYAAGTLTSEESDRFEVHLIGCENCQTDVRLAAAVRGELRTRTQRRRLLGRSAAVMAAAAAAVVVIVLVPRVSDDRATQIHRSDGASVEPTPLSPTGEVANALWLKWTRVPDATGYEVKVFTADGNVVWETRVKAESVAVRPRQPLRSGNSYFWIVAAELQDGSVARSAATRFQLKP